jgi:hypothetical protein
MSSLQSNPSPLALLGVETGSDLNIFGTSWFNRVVGEFATR